MFIDIEIVKQKLQSQGFIINDPWDIVDAFEKKVADYAGSKFGVSVDNCTDALFLCLKYLENKTTTKEIVIPKRTYLSVPQSIIHAGYKPVFKDIEWDGCYHLEPLPIVDSATKFTKGMYVKDTYYCLSFHKKKNLPISKGGMILTDDYEFYKWLKIARYEGRHTELLYEDDDIDFLGWNMYMPPEQAARGIVLFDELVKKYSDSPVPNCGGSYKYRDLTTLTVFKEFKND